MQPKVNLQKILPKIEEKIKAESEKEILKDSVAAAVKDSSKTQEKAKPGKK